MILPIQNGCVNIILYSLRSIDEKSFTMHKLRSHKNLMKEHNLYRDLFETQAKNYASERS